MRFPLARVAWIFYEMNICVVIVDSSSSSISNDGMDPRSDDDGSLYVEYRPDDCGKTTIEEDGDEFLYGYFDQSLFEEEATTEVPATSIKKTRIIQSNCVEKEEILACLHEYTNADDIVQFTQHDGQIRFIVDLSSEECLLVTLASAADYMTISDSDGIGNTSPDS